jgi:hypothetical protein
MNQVRFGFFTGLRSGYVLAAFSGKTAFAGADRFRA